MTDKVWAMLSALKAIITTEVGVSAKYYGYFPEGVQLIGNKYPAILLRDGDEETELNFGTRIKRGSIIVIYQYTNDIIDRIKNALTLQRKITDACLKDLTINNTAVLIEPLTIEKGEYSETPDKFNAGIYPNLTVRKSYYNVLIYDTRSL